MQIISSFKTFRIIIILYILYIIILNHHLQILIIKCTFNLHQRPFERVISLPSIPLQPYIYWPIYLCIVVISPIQIHLITLVVPPASPMQRGTVFRWFLVVVSVKCGELLTIVVLIERITCCTCVNTWVYTWLCV